MQTTYPVLWANILHQGFGAAPSDDWEVEAIDALNVRCIELHTYLLRPMRRGPLPEIYQRLSRKHQAPRLMMSGLGRYATGGGLLDPGHTVIQ